jgi:hypothetical protein
MGNQNSSAHYIAVAVRRTDTPIVSVVSAETKAVDAADAKQVAEKKAADYRSKSFATFTYSLCCLITIILLLVNLGGARLADYCMTAASLVICTAEIGRLYHDYQSQTCRKWTYEVSCFAAVGFLVAHIILFASNQYGIVSVRFSLFFFGLFFLILFLIPPLLIVTTGIWLIAGCANCFAESFCNCTERCCECCDDLLVC